MIIITTPRNIIALVWSIQIFESLHPNAYRDILLNYTGAYIAVGLVYYLYSKVGKSRLKGVQKDGSTGRDELAKSLHGRIRLDEEASNESISD